MGFQIFLHLLELVIECALVDGSVSLVIPNLAQVDSWILLEECTGFFVAFVREDVFSLYFVSRHFTIGRNNNNYAHQTTDHGQSLEIDISSYLKVLQANSLASIISLRRMLWTIIWSIVRIF